VAQAVVKTEKTESSLAQPRSKSGWRWVIRIGGTLLLGLFVWRVLNVDLAQVGAELANANLLLIGLSVAGVVPLIAVKSWRWQNILHDLGIHISHRQSFRLYAWGLAVGSFTPGQAGDFIKVVELKRAGHSFGTVFLSNVLDRLFDLVLLVLLATTGIVSLGADFAGALPSLLVLLGGLSVILLVLALPAWREKVLGFTVRKLLRRKLQPGESLPEKLPSVRFGRLFGQSLLATLVAIGRVWLIALAIGLNLSFIELVAAANLATVAALLPISVAGIGVRDAALAGILQKLGYAAEKGVALSTFMLLLQAVNVVVGWAIWKIMGSRELRATSYEQ
jgi:glycosyltransferase 2 family protein